MSESDQDWRVLLDRAEEDATALHLLLGVAGIAPRIFGFHAQQAVEKAAKAWLISLGFQPRRSHSLAYVFGKLAERGVELPACTDELVGLQEYAVDAR